MQPLLLLPLAIGLLDKVDAECWIRSDGIRICDDDEIGWFAIWWFWFAILFFLCTCTGGGYYFHRGSPGLFQQGFATYSEPLIPQKKEEENQV